jgi:acyl dehydratase
MTVTAKTIHELVGQELGVSAWQKIDQARIDQFAACTGDHQWVHVDAERAKKGPFGTTVAHGFLTLSLLASTALEVFEGKVSFAGFLNYGLDKVRFIAPVKVDSNVRNRIKLLAVEAKGPGRTLLTTENTLEIEGEEKPALVAIALGMALG